MNSKGSLYSRVASALGFDSGMEVTMNHQNLCPCEGAASQNQSDCVNTTCYNSVSHLAVLSQILVQYVELLIAILFGSHWEEGREVVLCYVTT